MKPSSSPLAPIFSLQTKLITLMSLIIIFACMCLGLYFIDRQIRDKTDSLIAKGHLLAKNLSHNGRYNLFTKDQIGLEQIIQGTLPVKEVVYVVFTDASGVPLAQQSKGLLNDRQTFTRTASTPLYPDPQAIQSSLKSFPAHQIQFTPFRVSRHGQTLVLSNHGKAGTVLSTFFQDQSETIYDFALPIGRTPPVETLGQSLAFELDESSNFQDTAGGASPFYGLVHVGLTDAYLQRDIRALASQAIFITCFIILIGLVVTIVVAKRMTIPLNALTQQASQVASGNLSSFLEASSDDEIGQLTLTFNRMIHTLRSQQDAMRQHIHQLQALNIVGGIITTTSQFEVMLSETLQTLVKESDFRCTILGLYDDQQGVLTHLYSAGFSDPPSQRPLVSPIPVPHNGGLLSQVLLQHQSLVTHNVAMLSTPPDKALLPFAHGEGTGSFVIAPIQNDSRVFGFLAASKGAIRCEQNDLAFLHPIATKLGIGIDRAHAYFELEELTQTLEQRVHERTKELNTANKKLQDLDRLKSTFVSLTSHELRTPLTSIKVFVENLLQGVCGPMTSKQSQYLTRVKVNVDRLRRMITELLDLSQIESGRLTLSCTSLSLVDLIQDALDGLRPVAYDYSVVLQFEPPGSFPLVYADRDKVFQILTNLIHNAIKFSETEGEVCVGLTQADTQHLEVCISDSGCGIETDDLEKIFQPFYRCQTKSQQNPGAGLGLALTRHLVRLHRGQLWAESTPGQGSRFYFTLPLESQHNPALA